MAKYKFDTHVHTSETSPCGYLSGAEIATRYHRLGFDGIVITDHLGDYSIRRMPGNHIWENCVDGFLKGYRAAKTAGERLGLKVILGAEFRFKRSMSDYLVYGFDRDFLLVNPFLYKQTLEEFYEKYKDELLIIQAHPYRDGSIDATPDLIHGVEVENCNKDHNNYNHKARRLAKAHPHLHKFKGSDTHAPGGEGLTHMLLDTLPEDSFQFVEAIVAGAYE